jgi:hypothetical protein
VEPEDRFQLNLIIANIHLGHLQSSNNKHEYACTGCLTLTGLFKTPNHGSLPLLGREISMTADKKSACNLISRFNLFQPCHILHIPRRWVSFSAGIARVRLNHRFVCSIDFSDHHGCGKRRHAEHRPKAPKFVTIE